VLAVVHKNLEIARKAVAYTVKQLDEDAVYPAHTALDTAIATARDKIPADVLDRLMPIVKRALKL
jgi:hypothetical protein